jgi:Ser/Thr protein kinase RdoA (MazF antagonist)
VADSVCRVGNTVRKPAGRWTPAVDALLAHLAAAGFAGAPRALGRDDQDRQMLEYVPGRSAHDLGPLSLGGLRRVGALIRDLHDATEGFIPPADACWQVEIPPDREDLICHHDLGPWNLIVGARRWVFIDWDGAGPGSRLWDLAYAVTGFVPMQGGGDPSADGSRLRALADGYRLSPVQRAELPPLIAAHTTGMFQLLCDGARTGRQPWARLHAEGHARYWGASADYISRNLGAWTRALAGDA